MDGSLPVAKNVLEEDGFTQLRAARAPLCGEVCAGNRDLKEPPLRVKKLLEVALWRTGPKHI